MCVKHMKHTHMHECRCRCVCRNMYVCWLWPWPLTLWPCVLCGGQMRLWSVRSRMAWLFQIWGTRSALCFWESIGTRPRRQPTDPWQTSTSPPAPLHPVSLTHTHTNTHIHTHTQTYTQSRHSHTNTQHKHTHTETPQVGLRLGYMMCQVSPVQCSIPAHTESPLLSDYAVLWCRVGMDTKRFSRIVGKLVMSPVGIGTIGLQFFSIA